MAQKIKLFKKNTTWTSITNEKGILGRLNVKTF